jgi:hypothetical protein
MYSLDQVTHKDFYLFVGELVQVIKQIELLDGDVIKLLIFSNLMAFCI